MIKMTVRKVGPQLKKPNIQWAPMVCFNVDRMENVIQEISERQRDEDQENLVLPVKREKN